MMGKTIEQLKVKLFFDGVCNEELISLLDNPFIKGLTTNPTLMRKEGIVDYPRFAKQMLEYFPHLPISFAVCADDFSEMEKQALEIASWGKNVFVKIPIVNSRGETASNLIRNLSAEKIKLNITAVMTTTQIQSIVQAISPEVPTYVSIFAGRIADTGRDPILLIKAALELIKDFPLTQLIWASSRELYNIFQADAAGCHVVTLSKELIKKLPLIGYELEHYSIDTVKMFYSDALAAGLVL